MQETRVPYLGQEDPRKKEMATHSSTLAWKIRWMKEPHKQQFMGSQRVGHNWAISLSLSFTFNEQSMKITTNTITQREPFYLFIYFISWRLITLQYCSGFCHTLTWISHGFTCIPIPIPPPTSLYTWSLWVFPVHQALALVSCIQPGLVICFTLDNIHVLMLFSWNIPPSPSPIESKSLFYTSVSLFLFCI